MVVVLAIICAAAAIALGAVNSVTEKPISDNLRDKSEAAMREVFASSYYDEIEFDAARHPLVTRFYEADGGYVAEVAPNGFNGAVTLMVGICADEGNQDKYLTISGVAVVSHSETSGLGAEAQNPDWLAQFVGNRHSELSKDGGSIDALTGATITSRAVVSGVNAAIALVTDAENISGAASATEDQLAKEDVYAK
ncbi:MAG: RnfABCDGE type electron transport complex subunit G [Oscillospiraceae bacterium]|nr:RnfABCDGE type electron transport complex subunit G [Oscillospiraceae bacterium]